VASGVYMAVIESGDAKRNFKVVVPQLPFQQSREFLVATRI